MLVGSDCNVDVGSNMDKVFQIVVRARGVGKSLTGGVGAVGGLEILLGGHFYQVVKT